MAVQPVVSDAREGNQSSRSRCFMCYCRARRQYDPCRTVQCVNLGCGSLSHTLPHCHIRADCPSHHCGHHTSLVELEASLLRCELSLRSTWPYMRDSNDLAPAVCKLKLFVALRGNVQSGVDASVQSGSPWLKPEGSPRCKFECTPLQSDKHQNGAGDAEACLTPSLDPTSP